MGKFMSMALQNTVNSASWKRIDKFCGFIIHSALILFGRIGPVTINITCIAIVSQMS